MKNQASAGHMKGINNLPRLSKADWQAQQINAASSRLYGGKTWDPLARQWLDPNGQPVAKPTTENVFARTSKLTQQLDRQLQKQINKAVADKAPKHATLHSEVPSTCLADLSWRDGIATATFYRGGDVVYTYPMSKADFLDWIDSDSIGKYGNENVF